MLAHQRHRGSFGRRPGNGPFGTLDRAEKSQIVVIGTQTDWPEIQKDSEAPQIACPSCQTPIPPSVTFCLSWGGCSRAVCRCSSVSPSKQLPQGPQPSRPGPPSDLPSPGCGRPSFLPPQLSSAGPPLGSPPPSPEDPPRAEHPTSPHPLSRSIWQWPCGPQLNPFNMLIFLAKFIAWVLSLTFIARNPNKAFKFILF